MSAPRRPERELADRLLDLYLEPAPAYRLDVLAQTSRMRQRARWTFPERWLPMALVRRRPFVPVLPARQVMAVAALLLLLVLAGVAILAGSSRPVPPPFGVARNGLILYGLDGDIYARDTPDGPARLLIGGPGTDEGPTFSRRGDKFIFFRRIDGADSYDLWVADADGSHPLRLGGPFADVDTWDVSPDGTTALVASRRSDGRMGIELLPLDGSPTTILPLPMEATWPRFRPPDGGWISFRGGDPTGRGTLYLVHPDRTGLHSLPLRFADAYPDHALTHGMDWSSDGRTFAFVAFEATPNAGYELGLRIHLATVDPAGELVDQRQLEFDPTADQELNPNFRPGTNQLLWNTRDSEGDFVSIGVPGTPGGRRVGPTTTTSGGIDYAIAPDGKTALVLIRDEHKTYLYDFDQLTYHEVEVGTDEVSTYQRLAP